MAHMVISLTVLREQHNIFQNIFSLDLLLYYFMFLTTYFNNGNMQYSYLGAARFLPALSLLHGNISSCQRESHVISPKEMGA